MKSRTMPKANTGRAWESELECAARGVHGLVLFRVAPDERRGRRGPPDFLGVWPGGRALAVEAKSTDAASWPLSKLDDHQRDALSRVDAAGGVGLLAVQIRGRGWLIPWPALAEHLARGERASVPWDGIPGALEWTGWHVAARRIQAEAPRGAGGELCR